MDFRQLAAAVKAHKLVAVLGVIVAVSLAFLAHVRVDPLGDPMFQYRKAVVWTSTITLQLTQQGFFEGRVQDEASRRDALIGLTPLYARLANSDQVRSKMRAIGPIYGGIDVDPVVDDNRVALPLIRVSSFTLSASNAVVRAQRQATAFSRYLAQQQSANDVAERNRVMLRVVSGPSSPSVVAPRKITLPVVVLLSILIITGAIILTLENVRKTKAAGQRSMPEAETRPPLEALKDPEAAPIAPAPSIRAEPAASNQAGPGRKAAPTRTLRADVAADSAGSRQARDKASPDGSEATSLPDAAQGARASRQPRG
jgi:hypothetical protein